VYGEPLGDASLCLGDPYILARDEDDLVSVYVREAHEGIVMRQDRKSDLAAYPEIFVHRGSSQRHVYLMFPKSLEAFGSQRLDLFLRVGPWIYREEGTIL
jgi:hypothetical protein